MKIIYWEENPNDFELIINELMKLYPVCNIKHVKNQADLLSQLTQKKFDLILINHNQIDEIKYTILNHTIKQASKTPIVNISSVLNKRISLLPIREGFPYFVHNDKLSHYLILAIDRAFHSKEMQLKHREMEKKLEILEKKILDYEDIHNRLSKRVRGFLRIDLSNFNYSLVDHFFGELSGYSLEKWYNTPNFIQEIICSEFQEYYVKSMNNIKEGFVPKVMEYKIIRKDGEERWWLQFNIGAYNVDGKLVSISAIIIDNSDNKEREIKYQNLFENVIGGIFRVDLETDLIVEANQKMVELLGFHSKDEVKNKIKSKDCYFDPRQREVILNTLCNEGIIEDSEFLIKNKNGESILVSLSAKIFPKEGFVEGIIINITKRKQIEEKLAIERIKAEKYFDMAGSLLVIFNRDETIRQINKRGCEILGYSYQEIIGKNWIDNFLPKRVQKKVRTTFKKTLNGEISRDDNFVNLIVTKNGEERKISWYNSFLRDSQGMIEAIISSGEDITEKLEINI